MYLILNWKWISALQFGIPENLLFQTFHEAPVRTVCPHCRADIVTATHYESGTFSWLICVILCLVG